MGCSDDPKSEGKINYATLAELDTTISVEIKENENFLPGRLQDLIIAEDGSLIVSDWGNMSIYQFDANGSLDRIIAEKGQGPGGLKAPFSLIDSKRDTLLVKFLGMSGQTDFYVWDDEKSSYFYDSSSIKELENGRLINIFESSPGFGFFAKNERPIPNRNEYLFNPAPYKHEAIAIVNSSSEIVTDSLHVIKTPNTIFIEAQGGAVTPIGAPPFMSKDYLKYLTNNNYFLTKTEDGIIQVFDQNHNVRREIILNVVERSISREDLDKELQHIPDQFRGKLRERAPNIKPPFIDIWASSEHFLLHTDMNEQLGKEMVLLTRNGEPIGKFYLSDISEIHNFLNHRIYTIHRDQGSGHSIRIYEIII